MSSSAARPPSPVFARRVRRRAAQSAAAPAAAPPPQPATAAAERAHGLWALGSPLAVPHGAPPWLQPELQVVELLAPEASVAALAEVVRRCVEAPFALPADRLQVRVQPLTDRYILEFLHHLTI